MWFTYVPIYWSKKQLFQGRAWSNYFKNWEDQIFYCNQRGIGTEAAIALIVNGYCKDVLNQLPMEFAVEAQKLLEISLEGSVG